VKVGYFIRFGPEDIGAWLDAQRVAVGTGRVNELDVDRRPPLPERQPVVAAQVGRRNSERQSRRSPAPRASLGLWQEP